MKRMTEKQVRIENASRKNEIPSRQRGIMGWDNAHYLLIPGRDGDTTLRDYKKYYNFTGDASQACDQRIGRLS